MIHPPDRSVLIATFVTDAAQYSAMRESFEQSGFTAPHTRYEQLSDQAEEPYAAITRLGQASEPYVVLVHQDVRCDQGSRYDDLIARLRELSELDPRWAVAGNAGGTAELALLKHVSDPFGAVWVPRLPRQVVTLDENFLVLNTAARPRCSAALAGFHFYGTDVCLNAALSDHRSYVIDFRLTHLSAGSLDAAYLALERRLIAHWSQGRWFAYVRAPWALLPLSRFRLLRRLMVVGPVRGAIFDRPALGTLYARLHRGSGPRLP